MIHRQLTHDVHGMPDPEGMRDHAVSAFGRPKPLMKGRLLKGDPKREAARRKPDCSLFSVRWFGRHALYRKRFLNVYAGIGEFTAGMSFRPVKAV